MNTKVKKEAYEDILPRVEALLETGGDWISALSTVTCELHEKFTYFHWTGFYRVHHQDILVVGPYQGSHGCLTINIGKGVCGKVAETGEAQIVDDVSKYEGHIACSASTQSEIVVPVTHPKNGEVIAVLDVDSDLPKAFDQVDLEYLKRVCRLVSDAY